MATRRRLNARDSGRHPAPMSSRNPSSKARLKKAQLSFYAEPSTYSALKLLSARTGVPQQVYLRRGLAHVLKSDDAGVLAASVAAVRGHAGDAMQNYLTAADRWNKLEQRWGELAGANRKRAIHRTRAQRSRQQ